MNSTADTKSHNQNDKTLRFTPRELIKYHMEHPEISITDQDIENLILDYQVSTPSHNKIENNGDLYYSR